MKKLPLVLLTLATLAMSSQAQARCLVNVFGRFIIYDPGNCNGRKYCVDLLGMFEAAPDGSGGVLVKAGGASYPLASDAATRAFKAKFPSVGAIPTNLGPLERELAPVFARKGPTTLPKGVYRKGDPLPGVWDGGCDNGGCTPAGARAAPVGFAPLRPAEF